MNQVLRAFFIFSLVISSYARVSAQCANCDAQWPPGTNSTTSSTLQTVSTCMFGGEYAVFSVTAGQTYTWTTCGFTAFDTQLTLYQGGAPGCIGGSLAYNDDACGLQSTITWTATFTGTVNVLVSQFFCASNATCMTLQWACTSCGTAGGGYNNPGGTINTCSGTFYDTGGPTGSYNNNEFIITTFCPDAPGVCISFNFTSFNIESGWDFLTVFDGPNTGSPIIGDYTGTALNGGTVSATNASGCLTFLFDSDGSVNAPGWAANISCVTCGTPPPASEQDCLGGTTVCSDATFSGNSSGSGPVVDLNFGNQGCLASGENQSSWYLFSPATNGSIGFTISPGVGVDYDFAVWGPYPAGSSSSVICPPAGPPIRCSYASGLSTSIATGSYNTGIGHPVYSPPQFASPFVTYTEGAGGDGWVSGLTVTAGQVYVLVIDNFSANTTPFNLNWNLQNGATLDCTPLPVELIELSGQREGLHNILRWKTATETNADYFAIERSSDGINYQLIGEVSASGNSAVSQSYVYRDENPSLTSYYYRLKQLDYNGGFEYFGPVFIESPEEKPQFGAVHPNPLVNGQATIKITVKKPEHFFVRLSDALGQPVKTWEIEVSEGGHELPVNLQDEPAGVYQLHFTLPNGELLHTSKIIR